LFCIAELYYGYLLGMPYAATNYVLSLKQDFGKSNILRYVNR